MKTILFAIAFSSLLAFGQKGEMKKMNAQAAVEAWAGVNYQLPENTPQITGGALITEAEPNGFGRKVWLLATQSGAYLVRGKDCVGSEIRLGEVELEANPQAAPHTPAAVVAVYDSNLLSNLPFFPQVCTVEVLRISKGRIERNWVGVDPWDVSVTKIEVGNEGVTPDGKFQLSIPTVPPDGIVVVGRETIASTQTTPFSSIVSIPATTPLPPSAITVTVCTQGRCISFSYERRFKFYPYTPPGKG